MRVWVVPVGQVLAVVRVSPTVPLVWVAPVTVTVLGESEATVREAETLPVAQETVSWTVDERTAPCGTVKVAPVADWEPPAST